MICLVKLKHRQAFAHYVPHPFLLNSFISVQNKLLIKIRTKMYYNQVYLLNCKRTKR